MRVKRNDTPVARARVTLRADAANVVGSLGADGAATLDTWDRGEAHFLLEPRTHTVEVDVEASALGLTGNWEGLLPVIPGAIWLDPAWLAARELRVTSPVSRDIVYATLSTRSARLWGGVIPLSSDARGFAAGMIAWPVDPSEMQSPVWLTLSSDPRASGAGTVGWPLDDVAMAEGELAFRDWLLLDGMPAAEQRDADRRARTRRERARRSRGHRGCALRARFVRTWRAFVGLGARRDRHGRPCFRRARSGRDVEDRLTLERR